MSEPCRHERFDADVREYGALGAALAEVERLRAEVAGECAHTALSLVYRQERDDALATIERVRALADQYEATAEVHAKVRDIIPAGRDGLKGTIAAIARARAAALATVGQRHAAQLRDALEASS